jgi:trigger factor
MAIAIAKGRLVNVTVENLAPCKKLLRVELEAGSVDEAFESTTREFQRHAAFPGFRPGKAPRDMVVKRYAHDIEQEVKKKLIPEAYRKAVKEKNLDVVGYPDIEEIQFHKGKPLQFAATVETAPDFELPDYKNLPVKRASGQVTEADVERALTLLRERKVDFKTVERELKEGDVAVVNYAGTTDGKPITDVAPTARGLTEQKNFWISADKSAFIPGFAPQLLGARAGEKRTVNVDFPADFVTPALAGKKGAFEVEVVEVKEKIFPGLSDELAKSYGAESLEKLREGVRTDLQNELKYKQDRDARNQVVRTLLDKVQCELPESVVLQETRNVVYNIVSENQKRGISKEAIDQQKDQIFSAANTTAKERVKVSFLFQKIAARENIKVEQMEIAQRVQELAATYEMPADRFVKELEKRNGWGEIYEQLLNEKVIGFLVENARIEEVEPSAAPVDVPSSGPNPS